jgi:hypothetical protein
VLKQFAQRAVRDGKSQQMDACAHAVQVQKQKDESMRVLLLILGLFFVFPVKAEAPDTFAWERTRAQGVALARIVVSEDTRVIRDRQPDCKASCGTSGALSPDAHGIALTVEENAKVMRGVKSYMDVMQRLSPHVTGAVPTNRARQAWTSTLPATGKEQPEGWVESRDGNWKSYANNWVAFREEMVQTWLGGSMEKVVPHPPLAWGNAEDYERFKLERGLCRLPCIGCVNTFAAKKGTPGCLNEEKKTLPASLPATLASGL